MIVDEFHNWIIRWLNKFHQDRWNLMVVAKSLKKNLTPRPRHHVIANLTISGSQASLSKKNWKSTRAHLEDRNNFFKFVFFSKKKCIIHSESRDVSIILLELVSNPNSFLHMILKMRRRGLICVWENLAQIFYIAKRHLQNLNCNSRFLRRLGIGREFYCWHKISI